MANGNFRLQTNSPCINAGNNAFVPTGADLDDNPRIVGGTVDLGAYECQSPALIAYYIWLEDYGLSTHSSAVYADSDADGLNNWQEWRCLTDPTNALSVLRLLSALPAGTNVTVTWESVAGVKYFLERGTNLDAGYQMPDARFSIVATNIVGQPGTTTYTDTNAVIAPRLFYRAGVGN